MLRFCFRFGFVGCYYVLFVVFGLPVCFIGVCLVLCGCVPFVVCRLCVVVCRVCSVLSLWLLLWSAVLLVVVDVCVVCMCLFCVVCCLVIVVSIVCCVLCCFLQYSCIVSAVLVCPVCLMFVFRCVLFSLGYLFSVFVGYRLLLVAYVLLFAVFVMSCRCGCCCSGWGGLSCVCCVCCGGFIAVADVGVVVVVVRDVLS